MNFRDGVGGRLEPFAFSQNNVEITTFPNICGEIFWGNIQKAVFVSLAPPPRNFAPPHLNLCRDVAIEISFRQGWVFFGFFGGVFWNDESGTVPLCTNHVAVLFSTLKASHIAI